MKLTTAMLKRFISVPRNLFEVTNQHIIEVESYGKVVDATEITIGHVLTCEKHPNADTLSVTTVDVGDEVLQIICGAPNVAKGQYVIVAKVGAVLPGDFKIKNAKIRGIESQGMICSLNELGFEEKVIPKVYQGGIFYYDEPVDIGSDPLEPLGLEGMVLEPALTPNRGDLLSSYGFAFDLSAMIENPLITPDIHYTVTKDQNPIDVKSLTDGCPLYYAGYALDVTIKPSPWWLKSALIANDIKPINNVIDISNYVMLEYGTPLHMFDAKKFDTQSVVIRDAKPNEAVVTLDDIKRHLTSEDVVITNGKDVVAIAGVMGCANTMIDDDTNHVIIEAAYFDPKRIQKTSKRLNLRSDSSLRFERGVDPSRVLLGLQRAMELLVQLADAKLSKDINKAEKPLPKKEGIKVSTDQINNALGTSLDSQTIYGFFKRYGYEIKQEQDTFAVIPPSHRLDIEIPADIYEEIARIYGLNHIETKRHPVEQKGQLTHQQKRLRYLRHTLASKGLYEVITYSLVSVPEVQAFHHIGEVEMVLSPLSEDKKALRQSLINGLLQTVKYNQSRQNQDVNIFEVGHVFAKDIEVPYLGMAMSGSLYDSLWQKQALKADFYVLKGMLEAVFLPLGIAFTFEPADLNDRYHPHRQANILFNDKVIGHIAQVHPNVCRAYDIDETFVCELNLEDILNREQAFEYQLISKFPTITRDVAILVDDKIHASTIIEMIKQTGRPILTDVQIFDIYSGASIEPGKKSMAFRCVFNDQQKTLLAEDVDKVMKKITNRLGFSFQAVIR
ncbi:MAG: phenylalanine--tRNA ligase subunit beta [Acholeplasmataceae bacterium]